MSAQNIKCNLNDIPQKNLKQDILKHVFYLFFSWFTEDNIIGDGIHFLQGKKIEETTCQVKELLFFSESKISFK